MISEHNLPLHEVIAAAKRPDVISTLREFYARADQTITEKKATCWNSGNCCRFGQYGHRLYVTALEVAYYLAMEQVDAQSGARRFRAGEHGVGIDPIKALPVLNTGVQATDTCPHAYDGYCHARERRPLGCRIFYCDPNAQDWQGPLTEACLTELRNLHDVLNVPYFYADWMTVLKALSE